MVAQKCLTALGKGPQTRKRVHLDRPPEGWLGQWESRKREKRKDEPAGPTAFSQLNLALMKLDSLQFPRCVFEGPTQFYLDGTETTSRCRI